MKSLKRGNKLFLTTELFLKITEKNVTGNLELWCSVYVQSWMYGVIRNQATQDSVFKNKNHSFNLGSIF